ncbi:MAG TPA: CRTAC1 family protein [Actinomycetota bacterium]|nr:CRTAC1 family protein [Actinomycetota bacterium]
MTDRTHALVRRACTILLAGLVALPAAASGAGLQERDGRRAAPNERRAKDVGLDFENVTTSSGLYQETRTWGTSWTDYDLDGDPDVFIGRHWRVPRMFVNQSQNFTRLRRQSDFRTKRVDRHLCAWGEANQDGIPDLYCSQGADKGKGSGPNQLFIGDGNGNLIDRAPRFGVTDELGRGRTTNWLDFDSDGDLDLFVGNTIRSGVPNVMFRHVGEGFIRASVGVGDEVETVSSSWSDWDRDGDPDLLLLQHFPFRPIVYRNDDGSFRKVRIAPISRDAWGAGTWGDFDGDGWTDLHLMNKKRSLILRNARGTFKPVSRMRLAQGRMSSWFDADNDGDLDLFVVQGARGNFASPDAINRPDFLILREDGGFTKVTGRSLRGPRTGNGEAVSTADIDRDGLVDVLVTNGLHHWSGPNHLLKNVSSAANWVGVDLIGHDANPLGYGARVLVGAGNLVYWREVTDNASSRAQSEVGYVHLGIGSAATATINVMWPDGTVDCVSIPAGTVMRVQQETLPCA